jgi:hypothetical protein
LVTSYETQLTTLRKEIEEKEKNYQEGLTALNTSIDQLTNSYNVAMIEKDAKEGIILQVSNSVILYLLS